MKPDYNVIGKRIKNARIKNKLTQEELASKLNISVAYMSRMERGTTQVNLKRLTQIAEILNITPGYLLTGSNTQAKDYLREDFSQVLDKCSPEQQKLIYQISELVSKTKFKEKQ